MKCKCGCEKEVEQKAGRRTKEYYSDACRMRHNRTNGNTEQTKSEQIKSEQPKPNRQQIPAIMDGSTLTAGPVIELLLPANYGLPDCQCYHCRQNRSQPEAKQLIINHGPYKAASQLLPNEINRVSLPGDIDYVPQQVAC